MASGPTTSQQIDREKVETVSDFTFLASKINVDGDCSHKILKRHWLLGRKPMTNLDSILESRDITLPKNIPYSQSYGFTSYHVQRWKLAQKEGWALKNWWFPTVTLEKTLESPLYSKEIKLVYPKGNYPWIFTGRTGAEAPVLWPPDVKNRLTGKDPDAGEDWEQKEKGRQRMRWLDGVTDSMDVSLSKARGERPGSLTCCSSCGCRESNRT